MQNAERRPDESVRTGLTPIPPKAKSRKVETNTAVCLPLRVWHSAWRVSHKKKSRQWRDCTDFKNGTYWRCL